MILQNAMIRFSALALFLWSIATSATAAELYKSQAGPHPVSTLLEDWQDGARDRTVPVKVYYPSDLKVPCPVIIFSHGLGGSREIYQYLGDHWASYGYVVVHVQHAGSDIAIWKNPKGSVFSGLDPKNYKNRPEDVSFALTYLTELANKPGSSVLAPLIDVKRAGVAGHSFGAYTTVAVAGEKFVNPLAKNISFRDERFKAAIAMSTPVPQSGNLDEVFGSVTIPMFHMTGTKDDSPIGETKAANRRLPYDHMNRSPQYLVTFKDGDHMIFSGRRLLGETAPHDDVFHKYIRSITLAFWDVYLRDDPAAKSWLSEQGAASLGSEGVWEQKNVR
jgi:predicted dienelactone hydrolase